MRVAGNSQAAILLVDVEALCWWRLSCGRGVFRRLRWVAGVGLVADWRLARDAACQLWAALDWAAFWIRKTADLGRLSSDLAGRTQVS